MKVFPHFVERGRNILFSGLSYIMENNLPILDLAEIKKQLNITYCIKNCPLAHEGAVPIPIDKVMNEIQNLTNKANVINGQDLSHILLPEDFDQIFSKDTQKERAQALIDYTTQNIYPEFKAYIDKIAETYKAYDHKIGVKGIARLTYKMETNEKGQYACFDVVRASFTLPPIGQVKNIFKTIVNEFNDGRIYKCENNLSDFLTNINIVVGFKSSKGKPLFAEI